MTISSEAARVDYLGTSATADYDYTWRIFDSKPLAAHR